MCAQVRAAFVFVDAKILINTRRVVKFHAPREKAGSTFAAHVRGACLQCTPILFLFFCL